MWRMMRGAAGGDSENCAREWTAPGHGMAIVTPSGEAPGEWSWDLQLLPS